ncbi:Hermansky-Pudlak syndrome 1 protein isoform X3 [Lates japonicus]|uniref:Hermansky-Pudlak syndrome 1 protein isoform X3 n=1 Tax=Lates japonicus TaxID=270547 RepID=A0AAD3RF86_LATJO|nr:Hermansky-Pudlak syndrome 1 protein isoform X3 [Lates japonicus]
MKCLLIASESAEVLFHWTDLEFQQNIQEQYGASQEEGQGLPAFEDSISTLFAPIIISCSTMVDRLGDSYTSFTTENNHIYILHQFDECLYIAVNGDGEEGEDDLRRKIYVMKKMIEVLFGMVTLSGKLLRKELRPQDTEQRARLWKHLQSLLETYSHLRENDQSFLVEAVERLIHPTLCEQCIEFLERRLVQQLNSSVERAGEEVLHAFILVHTKLLAFYSSRNASTLATSDLLALIIMAQNMYPSNVDVDDPGPEDVESTSGSGPESFYTPEPSPTDRDSSGSDKPVRGSTPVFEFMDPDIQMAEDSLQTLEVPPPDPSTPRRVFLEVSSKDGIYPMMPHSMYCLPLWPGITLVLLTKIPTNAVATSVYKFLEAFAKLEKRLSEGQEGSAATRGQLTIHDIRGKLDKFIKALGPSELQCIDLDPVNLTYLEDFPGLIHFICVDRSTGQMIAPSLNITERTTSELGKGPLAQFIKSKVWSLVSTTRRFLQKGYSTVTLRDGDFYFCYFLWFENETGYKLEAGDIPILPDDSAPIGMLAWDYYRKLLRYYSKNHQGEVVKCYELLTVHLGVIPTEIILQHCRQLASKLWEPSRNPLL